MKWGEYSSDVQFVLQRSDKPLHQQQTQQQQPPQQKSIANNTLSSSKKALNEQTENDQTAKRSNDSRKFINIR